MPKRTLRILSIDDDPGCQRAAARFLTLAGGHIVETAYNGRDGLEKAASMKPDIILLDMVMPDMDGGQVLKTLYADASTRDIPVIIVSGADLECAKDALYLNRNLKHIEPKPAGFEDLLTRIEALLGIKETGEHKTRFPVKSGIVSP